MRAGNLVVSPTGFRAWRGERSLELTATEFRLLVQLARSAGGFVTRATLCKHVWGRDFQPRTNIVDGHIKGLRRKLSLAGESEVIATKRGVGYMLRA